MISKWKELSGGMKVFYIAGLVSAIGLVVMILCGLTSIGDIWELLIRCLRIGVKGKAMSRGKARPGDAPGTSCKDYSPLIARSRRTLYSSLVILPSFCICSSSSNCSEKLFFAFGSSILAAGT